MSELRGYCCDTCGTRQGRSWLDVPRNWYTVYACRKDGLHFCTKECLETWAIGKGVPLTKRELFVRLMKALVGR